MSLRPPRPALLAAALLTTAAAACGGGRSSATSEAPTPVAATGGQPGDTVYIVEYTVAAPRREQFERFFAESYFPALRQVARSDTSAARVLRQTRLLAPVRPSDDGTLSYLLVLDPIVRGETYDISALLRRVYAAPESARRYRQLTDSWARPFTARPYVPPAPRPAVADSAR